MCVIIDTNCLSYVFDRTSDRHADFEPVLKWILCGKGFIVYGGSKYLKELKKAGKYLNIFTMLRHKKKKLVILPTEEVDREENVIKQLITNPDFDDPHLVAMVRVSSCMIICSVDTRSVKFVTNSILYSKGVKPPKYYTGLRNVKLLTDKYVPDKYKPLEKFTKKEQETILSIL